MHTLSIAPPINQLYMDIGATSHMIANGGNLMSYFNLSIKDNIIFGSGHTIPFAGCGNTLLPKPYPPLHLINVLYTPHLIKNLVYVCKFPVHDYAFVEFDPFGFSMKEF